MAFGDIVLLRNRTPLGPFTRAQIQAGLGRGEFNARDLAHTPGLKEWLPLIEVLHHLDRETVQWPRPREDRPLPPLPKVASGGARADVPESPSTARLEPPEPARATPPQLPATPFAPLAAPKALGTPAPPATALSSEPAAFVTRALAFAIDCVVLF